MKQKALLLLSIILILAGVIITGAALAGEAQTPAEQAVIIHPQFALLDGDEQNVLDTGKPVSTMNTCGQCHDTEYIASHSFHTDLGLSSFGSGSAHTWDLSNGLFGQWNPLTYRYLSADGDERIDLGTSDWLRTFGARVVGGGPAVVSRSGETLPAGDPNPEGWDWQQSGVYEMDCFLCHFGNPNNTARIDALQAGDFQWANTATLLGTGLVEAAEGGYTWNPAAFTAEGELLPESVQLQDPSNENCAQCHGVVHSSADPLTLVGCSLDNWETATTGQVFAGQKLSNSGMNIADKNSLWRPFDVHAERGLKCTECHYSVNNPIYYQAVDSPVYLDFDPRRMEIGEYLQTPSHNFARGASAQTTADLTSSMRSCDGCHNAQDTHDWLPYVDQHMKILACETCHIPALYASALQSYDWTVLSPDGQAVSSCRGVLGNSGTLNDLVTGYTPVLMPHEDASGNISLAPYNLITSWYWVYDGNNGTRPVSLDDLQAAYFENGSYAEEIVSALDRNQDGALAGDELTLQTAEQQSVIANRLSSLGLVNPRIVGEVQPYNVNHSVAAGEWAIKDCDTCHSDASRVTLPIKLADSVPGSVLPEFVSGLNVLPNGSIYMEDSALYYKPTTGDNKLYVFGHDRVPWIDWLGGIFFIAVLGAVSTHGGLRFWAALKSPHQKAGVEKVYMYAVYERFWHWLQTFTIVLLLFTGLIIHRPDMFRLFSFPHIVTVHNILAVLLVINAALSLFYHLVSGEIRQYLPHPYGFFDQAIVQAKYYLQGIFKGEAHPFEKTPDKKLNPLQQITYFGILNVLLPLQVITGALMWGVAKFPQISGLLGGLPFLAPFHSLIAWLFASFIVAHVYLTTTGPEPLTSIKAMMLGWDDVEVHGVHSS
jgi:thiosulfate reductase cytochrome b subunit